MSIVLGLWLLPTLIATIVLLVVTRCKDAPGKRRLAGEAAMGLLVAGLPFLFVLTIGLPFKICLVVLQIWLLLLPLRLMFGRLDWHFLRGSTLTNCIIWLVLMGCTVIIAYTLPNSPAALRILTGPEIWGAISIVVAAGFIMQLTWTLKHYRLRKISKPLDLKQLPTVSVCIPARNEDSALVECLQAVLASDYPKLEVVVLDDCSQDKTAGVVRQFAHDGVQFIQGDTPAEGWLGKNQAMQTLAAQASGDLIVFMGVDVRLQPHSVSRLVHYALSAQAQMVSIVPQNIHGFDTSTLLSPLHYFWQLVLPITKRHVPVSSKIWLINADVLKQLGGFASVKHKIVPEGSFARRLATTNNYRFLLSNPELGMSEEKKWSSQTETSIRLLYPTFKRQPFYVLIGLVAIMVVMLAPFVIAMTLAIVGQITAGFWLCATAALLLWVSFGLVRFITHPKTWLAATAVLPITVMQELALQVISMLRYEFGDVNWKGRNVCYPVIAMAPSGVPFVQQESLVQTPNHD